MYGVGDFIKGFSKVIFGFVILAVLALIIAEVGDLDYYLFGSLGTFFIVLLVTIIFGSLGAVLLYGFGHLIEEVEKIGYEVKGRGASLNKSIIIPAEKEKTNAAPEKWICDSCKAENSNNYSQCKKCGKYRS